MEIERRVVLEAPIGEVFEFVDDLGRYPEWMALVHDVTEVDEPSGRAWEVELRAQVGPLARSKRLRMIRTVHDAPAAVAFERSEVDGRRHSPWVLESSLVEIGEATGLTMTLTYGGSLWTGAVLQRVLDDHIERGATALATLLADRSS